MTDIELLSRVVGILDTDAGSLSGLRRGGRLLIGLPRDREAFSRALRLYQPQRPAARMMVAALHALSRIGLPGAMLARIDLNPRGKKFPLPLPDIDPGTCGVLLGSPEHRLPRAISSYRHAGKWEVAKIAFGAEGAANLEQEARTLDELTSRVKGVPGLLGLHRGGDATLLRMPYLSGEPIQPGEYSAALMLLESWVTDAAAMPVTRFPEWPAIEAALAGSDVGKNVLQHLSRHILTPVICHGDFARWNLRRQADGSLVVLDWEWGHANGMPGIDLVHYFLQDARLVRKRPPAAAIGETIDALKLPACMAYLKRTGWGDDPLSPIIACLAWKQGAGQQENAEILAAALEHQR